MDFTLRFMLGLTLVLATCSVLDCASSWRHIRQAPPIEASPETPILHDGISNVNASAKEENISKNASNKIGVGGQLRPSDNDNQKAEKNEVTADKKPKTENSTEKHTRDNKINVNKTNNDDDTKVDKKTENKNETSLEKPLLKDLDLVADDSKQNYLKRESQKIENAQQKETTEHVPETKQEAFASRVENSRSLDMDISKYVSSEFHNKNNVYSLSVSPDTEKYTNLHNELPKSTTSRLPTEEPSLTIFGVKHTTPLDDDFDKKYQTIEDGVKQKLEYIDHQFPESDHDFKKSQEGEAVNISKILDDIKNDTTINLNYSKYTNIADNNSRDKNSIHKETDVESGRNVDFTTSYNKTQIFVELPKDYKNKIPSHEEEILSEVLPEHTDVKSVYKPTANPVDSKHLEVEVSNEKIPEINFKESTSLTKPPSLNQTENHKSLISNKIETEVVNPVENNMKIKWDFPFVSTEIATERSTRSSTTQSIPVTKSGQEEESVYVPYGRGNLINVSKRGSTKFVDTVKATTVTESSIDNKNLTLTNSASAYKLDLINKQVLASKKNKTMEQSVLENQVYPVQIPAPNKEQKDEKVINDTTEKSVTTEDATLSLKLYTMSHSPTAFGITTLKSTNLNNQTDDTTLTENVATTEVPEWTTYTMESTTILNVNPFEKTTTEELFVDISTTTDELETTTASSNLTVIANTEAIDGTTILYPTTLTVETTATNNDIKNNEFTTTTYRIDFPTELNGENSGSSQESVGSETTASEEVVSNISYSTDSEFLEYSDSNTPTSNYEDSGSTSKNSTDYSEYDERSSNGRDLKGTSNEPSFSSIDENLNNLDLSSPSTTTDKYLNQITTEEPVWDINKTETGTKTRTSETRTETTSDYRENIIIKQNESTTTTKRPEETSQEVGGKTNLTDNDVDENGEYETEDDSDLDASDHSTLNPRNVKPNRDGSVPETTPFMIPLNTSMETDGTDATTVADNLGLGSEDNVDGNGGPIAAIIISCIGAACLVILAGLLFVMRKRHKRFNYGQRCTPVSLDAYSVDNVSVYNSMRRKGAMRASKRSYGNPAFEDPSSISRSLNFSALAKFASNVESIAKEFEEIPQVTAQMNELPEGCETKNRYANVIPLPETRVFLSAIDGYPNSDYINANYVTGPKSTRGYYIACQAPMQSTVDDFWRMVWEQQTKVILMLTHLFENGTEKCVDYLPPSEVLDCHRLFGDFQVTLKKREVKEKYVISSLQLKNMVSNSWREVTHLWYLGWPEKGVPSEANSLIAFLIEARSYFKTAPPAENGKPKDTTNDLATNGAANSEQSPVIVHCSPGTGRTGTVIACDIAIREFELTRQVDIPKTVYRIRRDRASSVQTKEQYGFIYKVICLYATKLTGGVLDSL